MARPEQPDRMLDPATDPPSPFWDPEATRSIWRPLDYGAGEICAPESSILVTVGVNSVHLSEVQARTLWSRLGSLLEGGD